MSEDNIVAVLIFLFGIILGNRLTVWNDRRKELNAVSEPIFKKIHDQLLIVKNGTYSEGAVSDADYENLKMHLPWYERRKFCGALEQYQAAKESCGEWIDGRYNFHSPHILQNALERIQEFTKRK